MGKESATTHSFVALMSLAATYAKYSKWGMALDCASRAVSVAVRMGQPVLHADAMALSALITLSAAKPAVVHS